MKGIRHSRKTEREWLLPVVVLILDEVVIDSDKDLPRNHK